ncbi:MAG TPA: SDR family NAD(P)-dependent oxidoreductase, partial [Roseiflexaceae bacterium]|nr:SDR family NAD(P)-dependent oxidoreductase [Roseiflexaceae bacterium]
MNVTNKIVIITGASSGIGAATARSFAHAGARVVLAARDESKLHEVATGLPNNPLIVPTDVSDHDAAIALVERTVRECGAVDILVNNAGVGLAAPVAEMRREDLERAMAVNVYGPLALTQAVLPHMRARGSGQIIFVSSVVGMRALPYLSGYAATKAALDRLVESLRVELRGSGIAVTLVRPGTTRTSFSARRIGGGHEKRRFKGGGVPSERVAEVILEAARKQPRVAYVKWSDRMQVLF